MSEVSDITRARPYVAVPQQRRRVVAVGRRLPERRHELFLQRVSLRWLVLTAAVLLAVSTVAGYLIGIRYR